MNSDPHIHVRVRAQAGTALGPDLRVTMCGATDRGLQRETNQDRFLAVKLATSGGHIAAVADGVGGANGGETASTLAIATIEEHLVPQLRRLHEQRALDPALVLGDMRRCIQRADARLCAEGDIHAELYGMATTLTIAALVGRRLFVAHVGDSRCYLLREDRLSNLTLEQTVTAELIRRGQLDEEGARQHVFRNVLTDYVGGGPGKLRVQVRNVELRPGDTVLVCSDGLTDMVPADEIIGIIAASPSPSSAVDALLARANALGGRDNATAVVARCEV